MKTILKLSFLLVLFLAFSCTQPTSNQQNTKDCKIGLITPLSGPVSDLGKEILQSAELAISESNAKYGSFKFSLVSKDDGNTATTASIRAKSLVTEDKVVALIAAGTTGQVKAEIESVKGQGIPVITSTATESDLTKSADYVFRVIPSNLSQANALCQFANANKMNRIAILFQSNDDYSNDLKEAFKREFQAIGGVVTAEVGFESEETDFKTQIDRINAAKISAIACFAQHVQVSRVVIRTRQLGINTPILSGETAFTDKLLATVGNASGLYITGSSAVADSNQLRFEKAFLLKNGKKPGPYGKYTYDAVSLITYLAATKSNKGNSNLIGDLKALDSYKGVTGIIHFNEFGDVKKDYDIFKLSNGKFEKVGSGL